MKYFRPQAEVTTSIKMSQRMYGLSKGELALPSPVEDSNEILEPATLKDLDLILQWRRQFAVDVGLADELPPEPRFTNETQAILESGRVSFVL
jgi:hypothetical protein